MGVSISKFSRRGRVAANIFLVYLPLWARGRMATTPKKPLTPIVSRP